MLVNVIVIVVAYLLGSISFSVIFGKKFKGVDVRESGSKNAGTTNVLRVAGKKAAACALICDILKGVVAVLIAYVITKFGFAQDINGVILVQNAGIAAIIGHMFPIFYGFKGGKGVATTLGILLLLNWKIGLIICIFMIIVIIATKMVSVASLGAAMLYPVLVIFISDGYLILSEEIFAHGYFVFSIIIAGIIAYNHRANIKRLATGTENKISFKK